MTEALLSVKSSRFRADLDPAQGARLLRLDWRDPNGGWQALMPDPGAPPYQGRKATAFPLIPFGGRLRDAQLHWCEQVFQFDPVPEGSPHVLHGDGSRRAWKVLQARDDHAVLALDWPSRDWPFAASAKIGFHADAAAFEIRQSVSSRSATPIPFGLGWHPYFRLAPASRLSLSATASAKLDATGFAGPMRPHGGAVDFRPETQPGSRLFALGDGAMVLSQPDPPRRLTLGLDPAFRFLVVHVPASCNVIALEPLTHDLHAPERGVLEPNGQRAGTIRLTVAA